MDWDTISSNWPLIGGIVSFVGACLVGIIAVIWRRFALGYEGEINWLTAQIVAKNKHLALLGEHIIALMETSVEAKGKVETLENAIRLGDITQIAANSAMASAVITKLIAEGRGLAAHFVNPVDQSDTPPVPRLAAEAEIEANATG